MGGVGRGGNLNDDCSVKRYEVEKKKGGVSYALQKKGMLDFIGVWGGFTGSRKKQQVSNIYLENEQGGKKPLQMSQA